MPRRFPRFALPLLLGALLGAGVSRWGAPPARHATTEATSLFITNEEFVNGLYTRLPLDSTAAVFRYVFQRLRPDVTIYPSENYYYFEFTAQGKTVAGCLSLTPTDRDSAQIGFSYATKIPDKARAKYYFTRGGGGNLGAREGVAVRRLDARRVAVRYEGRTVTFHLHELAATPPRRARLRDDEEYVLSNFDDSGLQFHLLFSQTTQHLFWILNEDGYVPETFTQVRHLAVGDRTEFVFYADSLYDRKILVAVAGLNVKQNNWYDGPFDQLADNLIEAGQVRLKPYLVADFGGRESAINQYGAYSREGRMAVAPYTVYFSRRDLAFVDSLEALGLDYPRFCRELTRQRYDDPAGFFDGIVRRYY